MIRIEITKDSDIPLSILIKSERASSSELPPTVPSSCSLLGTYPSSKENSERPLSDHDDDDDRPLSVLTLPEYPPSVTYCMLRDIYHELSGVKPEECTEGSLIEKINEKIESEDLRVQLIVDVRDRYIHHEILKLNLVRLEVIHRNSYCDMEDLFYHLEPSNITELDLNSCRIERMSGDMLDKYFPSLYYLNIDHNPIRRLYIPSSVVKLSARMTSVRTIDVGYDPNIEFLDLESSNIIVRDPNVSETESDEEHHDCCYTDEESSESLDPYYDYNYPGEDELDTSVFLEMTNLKKLNLSHARFLQYVDLDHFAHCEELNLEYNSIIGLTYDTRDTRLKHVYFGGNPIDEDDLDKLNEYYRNTVIHKDIS